LPSSLTVIPIRLKRIWRLATCFGVVAAVQAAARYELGRDYESAGLLDRAESAYRSLIDDGQKLGEAFQSLLQLREREGDWQAAIDLAAECQEATGIGRQAIAAHYHCEMAEQAVQEQEIARARAALSQAARLCTSCPRPNLMLAQLAMCESDYEQAISEYALAEKKGPELMPEIISSLLSALKQIEDESRLRGFIETLRGRRNAYSVIRHTRGVIAELDGVDAADRFFKEQILRRPSLKGLRDWAEDQLQIARPGEREKVAVIHAMLDEVVEDKPAYQCNSCGFRGNALHWRCPSCGTWDSIKRIIGVEGE